MKKHPAKSHGSKMVSGSESVPVPHPEKLSRAPIPGGKAEYFHDGGANGPTATVPNGAKEDRRVPSTPNHGLTPHPEKVKTQGFADHEKARGRKYEYSEVEDAHDNPGVGREQTRKQVGGNVRNETTTS